MTHVGRQERKYLASNDSFMPLEASVRSTTTVGNVIAYLKHHGMLMVERQPESSERQIVDIVSF